MKEAEQGWQTAIDKIGERAGLIKRPDGMNNGWVAGKCRCSGGSHRHLPEKMPTEADLWTRDEYRPQV